MFERIKEARLSILRCHEPDAIDQDLDNEVLCTGYPDAKKPHTDKLDLIYVYAASLRNVSVGGPGFRPFALMIRAGIKSLCDKNLPFNLKNLAGSCREYLELPDSLPLTQNGRIDYPQRLQRLENGDNIGPPQLPLLLNSVVCFANFLNNDYDFSAENYHQSFNEAYEGTPPASFIVEKFNEIANFLCIGPAVGLNFFKDSQVPAFRGQGQGLAAVRKNRIGWYVKPDMHVLRFMLKLTGRQPSDLSDDELTTLTANKVVRLYVQQQPREYFPDQYTLENCRGNRQEKGYWRCIEDMHKFACQSKVAPLEIDRILYMAGSGKFPSLDGIVGDQHNRYERVFAAINGA